MSSDKSLLKKLISLVCAASSVGLSASAAETDTKENEVVGAVGPSGDFRSMSRVFDFTYTESGWRDKILKDRDERVNESLPLDDLSGDVGVLGASFKELVTDLADSCYEIRRSYAWSKGYVDDVRLNSLLDGSSKLWSAISSVCGDANTIASSGVGYGQLRKSFKHLSRALSDVVQALNNMELGTDVFLDFVRSRLPGYLRTCDAILSKRRIGSSLESDFSKQLDSVVVGSAASELGSDDGD